MEIEKEEKPNLKKAAIVFIVNIVLLGLCMWGMAKACESSLGSLNGEIIEVFKNNGTCCYKQKYYSQDSNTDEREFCDSSCPYEKGDILEYYQNGIKVTKK